MTKAACCVAAKLFRLLLPPALDHLSDLLALFRPVRVAVLP
jgi:hypothetical protein